MWYHSLCPRAHPFTQHGWPLLGCHRHVIRPASYSVHNQCRRIRHAKPQVCGFHSFEEPFNVLLQSHSSRPTSQAPPPTQSGEAFVGMAAAFAALALVSWDHNQVVQSWRPSIVSLRTAEPLPELPWSRCLSTRVTPLVLPLTVQWPQCQRSASCRGQARPPAKHPWPFVSPTSLVGTREFHRSLFDRCTLHFDPHILLFICVNSNQRVHLSGSVYVRRCACVCLENLLSRADVIGVHLVRGAHRPLVPSCRARTSARVRSTRHPKPAPAAWGPPTSTKLQRVQP